MLAGGSGLPQSPATDVLRCAQLNPVSNPAGVFGRLRTPGNPRRSLSLATRIPAFSDSVGSLHRGAIRVAYST
jgi:hypothetical protein